MNVARALEADCSKCGPLRIMLPVGQQPNGAYVRCPFCRKYMLEWRWIAGTTHTSHTLPYAERLGMTQTGPRPERVEMEQEEQSGTS
jgi:hypothetical protein